MNSLIFWASKIKPRLDSCTIWRKNYFKGWKGLDLLHAVRSVQSIYLFRLWCQSISLSLQHLPCLPHYPILSQLLSMNFLVNFIDFSSYLLLIFGWDGNWGLFSSLLTIFTPFPPFTSFYYALIHTFCSSSNLLTHLFFSFAHSGYTLIALSPKAPLTMADLASIADPIFDELSIYHFHWVKNSIQLVMWWEIVKNRSLLWLLWV